MAVNIELVSFLMEQGLSGEVLLKALSLADTKSASSGAARQARHRIKLQEVTESDVTPLRKSDVTPSPNEYISNPSEPSLRSEIVQARKADFAKIRAAYPKKVGANPWQPAEEKHQRLTRDGVLSKDILDGVIRYAASRAGEDPKFTCSLLVFLNQRRWLDDHVVAEPRQNGHQARAGPPYGNNSIDAANSLLRKMGAWNETASRDSPDIEPGYGAPALAFPHR